MNRGLKIGSGPSLGGLGGFGINGGRVNDTTSPTVVITSSESSPSFANPIPLIFTLSEPSTDFAVGDVIAGTGTYIGNFAGSGVNYTADLTITGSLVTALVDIGANVFHDSAGNGNVAAQFSIISGLTLFDQFTTNQAAPLTTPRIAEPGPGTLVIGDTANNAAIVSSQLVFNNAVGNSNPSLWGNQQILSAGLTHGFKLNIDSSGTMNIGGGWDNNQTGPALTYVQLLGSSQVVNHVIGAVGGRTVSGYSRGQLHSFALVHRGSTAGGLLMSKPFGGNWALEWVSNQTWATALYPQVMMVTSGTYGAAYADNMKVVNLPAPFNDANGLATNILTGTRSQGDVFSHEADCTIEFICTTLPSSGQHEIQFRKQDATNYWQLDITTTGTMRIDEVINGSLTNRASSGAFVANGQRIVIRCNSTTIEVYQGADNSNSTRRINYTTATNFATATGGSILTIGAGGGISKLITWPYLLSGSALAVLQAAFP